MTADGKTAVSWASTRKSFDSLVDRLAAGNLSFIEADLLRDSHWAFGEDARLREDLRFRPTAWGRWIHAGAYLANDAVFGQLHRGRVPALELDHVLRKIAEGVGRKCVLCPGDPRLVVEGAAVRLSARELSNEPLVEPEVNALEGYVTHLPIRTLRAAAASLPAGEWGPNAREQEIETMGWLRVTIPGRQLNPRMFVARIEGNSMDDGRSGLVDGGYVVFELWPAGSRQGLNVLVRGSFSDPETGSYAVKKYLADERDNEGTHRRITLVSLNEDKVRFPPIELSVDRDEEVTVVAKVVRALTPGDFARVPRPIRRPGRRDLKATDEIFGKLSGFGHRFFGELWVGPEPGLKEAQPTWNSEFVCLEAEAGGLHIEVGPLAGLWSFLKQLRIDGSDWKHQILASNVRHRSVRFPVPASSGPWQWAPIGFEDDPDIDLSGIALPALDIDSVHVFRVDVAGIGRKLTGRSLSLGQHYRLLFPDSVWKSLDSPPVAAIAGGDGWHLWDIEITDNDLGNVLSVLRQILLDIGESETRLEWVLVPAAQWKTSPKGEQYPCFLASPGPVISIAGPPVETDAGASLYLQGEAGNQILPLTKGSSELIRVGDLLPGRYSVAVLYERTKVPPSYAAFEILQQLPEFPKSGCRILVGGQSTSLVPKTPARLAAGDLGGLDSPDNDAALRFEGPPGWPVRVAWREVSEDLLRRFNVNTEGDLDESGFVAVCAERARRRPVGDLVIDASELGWAQLPHHHRPTPEIIRSALKGLLLARGETAQRLAGQYEVLLTLWFEPICAQLGYELESVASEPDSLPSHFRVCKLFRVERRGKAMERRPRRILVLAEDIQQLPQEARAWLDDLCSTHNLRELLVTDGLLWALHRWDSRVPLKVWNLELALADEGDFMAFLRDAAEGV